MDSIAHQIADQHECPFCGSVRALHVEQYCGDEDINTLEVTLLSQATLPERRQVSVKFANLTVENLTVEAGISGICKFCIIICIAI